MAVKDRPCDYRSPWIVLIFSAILFNPHNKIQPISCVKLQRRPKISERDVGQEILGGIREIKVHKASNKDLRTHTLMEPAPVQDIRAKFELS